MTGYLPKAKINILLTSAGGSTGTYLIRLLKKCLGEKVKIVAVDANNNVPAKVLADRFYVVPSFSNESEYLSSLQKIVAEEKITHMIPVTSYDMDFYTSHPLSIGVKRLIVDEETNRVLSNKRECYRFLSSLGVYVPRCYEGEMPGKEDYPLFFKPCQGSGSKKTHKIIDAEDYLYWKAHSAGSMFMEFLGGDEFTVDCLFDNGGKCVGFFNRKREKTVSGGAVVTTAVCDNETLFPIIRALESMGKLRGPINFQYIKNSRGQPVVFDFNTRFASGGLPLAVECGFNIPLKLIELMDTGYTELYIQIAKTDGTTMIRYYDELFVRNVS